MNEIPTDTCGELRAITLAPVYFNEHCQKLGERQTDEARDKD